MKKILISLLFALAVATVAAQTNYYPGSAGTIAKSGYTYKYRDLRIGAISEDGSIQLYNADVTYLDKDVANRDGKPIDIKAAIAGTTPPSYSARSMTRVQGEDLIRSFFTSQQKAILKGDSFWVETFVDTSTGKVADVLFSFRKSQSYMNIPIETYRAIELALKQKFTVTVTAEGRKKNYIRFSWSPYI